MQQLSDQNLSKWRQIWSPFFESWRLQNLQSIGMLQRRMDGTKTLGTAPELQHFEVPK